MENNELNHNDDLDIVMIKLELTISEKQDVESIVKDNDLSYEEAEGYLNVMIGIEKTEKIIEWIKNNKY